jgi:lactate permease
LPIITLLGLLAFFNVKAHIAALAGVVAAMIAAVLIYTMPVKLALLAAASGAAYGLFPIAWIVLTAIFIFDFTVQTGQFEIIRHSIESLAADRRIQALFIAYSFDAFLEGAAGFGTPVAIGAAMLMGLGFKPLQAAILALIGNTAPVAFGAMGTPILALSAVTNIPVISLSAMVGRQLPLFAAIVPFWLIWTMAGFRAMIEVWPACLAAGASLAVAQFLASNYHGPWVVDIVGSAASMISLIVLLKFWQPTTTWLHDHERDVRERDLPRNSKTLIYAKRRVWGAWMPWILLSVFVFVWGLPQVRGVLDKFDGITIFKVPIPVLDHAIFRNVPIVPVPKAENAVFVLNWLSATGTSLFIAGVIGGLLSGIRPVELLRIFYRTGKRLVLPFLTMALMLALGFIVRYAGLDATMGLAFANTGVLFPFFSPILGWLGVAITGSDTSSNVLFGSLQKITAQQLSIPSIVAVAANSSGGVMGKMINAQSIVVAGAATGHKGSEGTILRHVFWHSLVLVSLLGVVILLEAYVIPWIIVIG